MAQLSQNKDSTIEVSRTRGGGVMEIGLELPTQLFCVRHEGLSEVLS